MTDFLSVLVPLQLPCAFYVLCLASVKCKTSVKELRGAPFNLLNAYLLVFFFSISTFYYIKLDHSSSLLMLKAWWKIVKVLHL